MPRCVVCEKSHLGPCTSEGVSLDLILSPDEWIGRVVKDRYRVLNTATDPDGVLLLAEDQHAGQQVVLRLLPHEAAIAPARLAEVRVRMVRLESLPRDHRHIAAVYGWERGGGDPGFVTTEYVEGRTLRDLLREEGALEIDRALRLGVQIAEGLQAGHDVGIVHGAMRPENVVLVGPEEVVKIEGWELAAVRGGRPARFDGSSPAPSVYMAPENLLSAEISVETDIYAFGVLLYEMLGGHVPFVGATVGELRKRQLRSVPARLGKVRQGVPKGVERLVCRALEKEPERRQESMGDITDQLVSELSLREQPEGASPNRGGVQAALSKMLASVRVVPATRTGRMLVAFAVPFVLTAVGTSWILASRPASPLIPPPRIDADGGGEGAQAAPDLVIREGEGEDPPAARDLPGREGEGEGEDTRAARDFPGREGEGESARATRTHLPGRGGEGENARATRNPPVREGDGDPARPPRVEAPRKATSAVSPAARPEKSSASDGTRPSSVGEESRGRDPGRTEAAPTGASTDGSPDPGAIIDWVLRDRASPNR